MLHKHIASNSRINLLLKKISVALPRSATLKMHVSNSVLEESYVCILWLNFYAGFTECLIYPLSDSATLTSSELRLGTADGCSKVVHSGPPGTVPYSNLLQHRTVVDNKQERLQ